MIEIDAVWLAKDRYRIAVRLDDETILITNYGERPPVTYTVRQLPTEGWDELFPETDFG